MTENRIEKFLLVSFFFATHIFIDPVSQIIFFLVEISAVACISVMFEKKVKFLRDS